MPMLGNNGGLIGARRVPGGGTASGLWTPGEQVALQRADRWVSDGFRPSVSLHLPFNGANNSTTFTDVSPFAHAITAVGDAKISTAQSRFGGSSGLFDGTGDHLTCPNTSGAFDFGSGDFTIRVQIYLADTTGNKSIVSMWPDTTGSWRLLILDSIANFSGGAAGAVSSLVSTPATTWTEIMVARIGGRIFMWNDGILSGVGPMSGSIPNGTSSLSIGRNEQSNTWFMNGHMNDLQITKGRVRETPNYAPRTVALPIN